MQKISIHTILSYGLGFGVWFMMGCNDRTSIPASGADKITNLVVQAESNSYNAKTAVDLTHQQILLENLALSADYFVDETHINGGFCGRTDSSLVGEPWRLRCNLDELKTKGFGFCLSQLELTEQEKVQLGNILKDYHREQLPLIRSQFILIERLNDSVAERIERAVEELNSGNEPLDSFQCKIQGIEKWFCETLHQAQWVSKTALRMSVNYRNTLEAIEQLLPEKKFRNFYLCHKQ